MCNQRRNILIGIVAAWGALWLLVSFAHWFSDRLTTQSRSPNGAYRIELVERVPDLPLKIDRNFRLYLVALDSSGAQEVSREIIFDSPDEGGPIGSERFIWSQDAEYVLLVGKHVFVETSLTIGASGEQAYFLYHLPTQQSWCNSRQANARHQALTADDLRGIDFAQPVDVLPPGDGA